MESKSNYTLIGLAVLLLTSCLLSALLWLSVGFNQKQYATFVVYMNEPVSGLSDESLVKYNGVKVGFIDSIELNPNNPQQVKLTLRIETSVPITEYTQASLIAQGITGATYLGLTSTSTALTPLKKKTNEPYPVIRYKPSFYFRLEESINRLSNQINGLFTPKNTHNISQTVEHIEKITRIFEHNTHAIDRSLEALPDLIDALDNSAVRVNVMAQDVSIASKQFTQTMRTGKNTIEQVSQQTIPSLVLLMRRVDTMTANLQAISNQLRQNPGVILRGSAPPKPGPGE